LGQKVNPVGYRIGVNKETDSIWFATNTEYVDNLHQDLMIKKYLKKRLESAMVSKITIQRKTKSVSLPFL